LKEEFNRLLGTSQTDKNHDSVFDDLKAAVRDESMKKHKWDEKAEDSLVRYTVCSLLVVVFKMSDNVKSMRCSGSIIRHLSLH